MVDCAPLVRLGTSIEKEYKKMKHVTRENIKFLRVNQVRIQVTNKLLTVQED